MAVQERKKNLKQTHKQKITHQPGVKYKLPFWPSMAGICFTEILYEKRNKCLRHK